MEIFFFFISRFARWFERFHLDCHRGYVRYYLAYSIGESYYTTTYNDGRSGREPDQHRATRSGFYFSLHDHRIVQRSLDQYLARLAKVKSDVR